MNHVCKAERLFLIDYGYLQMRHLGSFNIGRYLEVACAHHLSCAPLYFKMNIRHPLMQE